MQRKVILVLGMHRSGTSALARTLSFLGCDLPRTLVPETPTNPTGHWEPNTLMGFNNEILESAGSNWHDWLEFNPDWYGSPVAEHFLERGPDVLRAEYDASPLFVLKDPRNCRLTRFWFDVFDRERIEPLVVVPLRNPLEVVASLEARDGMHRDLAILLWLRHVLDAEQGSRDRRRVFATYEELLQDWALLADRMQVAFGIAWPRAIAHIGRDVEGFLDAGNRHHVRSTHRLLADPTISQWVRDADRILLKWAHEGEDREDHAALDQIRQQLNAAGPTFLRLTRDIDDERRRTADLGAQIAAGQDELTCLREELAALRESHASSAERQATQLAHHAAHAEQLEGQHSALTGELAQQRAQGEALAAALAQEQAARAELAEALEQAKTALADHQHDLAKTQSTLRQRDEEIHQTLANLERAREESAIAGAAQAVAEQQLEIVRAKLKAADEWVFRLAGDRKLAEGEVAKISRHLAVAERELARSAARNADLERQRLLDRQALDRLQGELANAATHQAEVATQVWALTQSLEEQETEVATARARASDAQAQSVGQRGEAEALSARLRQMEAEVEQTARQAEWLQQVNAVMTGYPRWWTLLPGAVQDKWRHQRLARRGLFDAEAYLRRYPDVSSSGMDPLRHYILHGMAENRTL